MNQIEIDALRALHARLIRIREHAVGIDLKRINHQIGEIEHTLDHIPRHGDHTHCRGALSSEPKEPEPITARSSAMAAEIIMHIQHRDYGIAEAKATSLMFRLIKEAQEQQTTCTGYDLRRTVL